MFLVWLLICFSCTKDFTTSTIFIITNNTDKEVELSIKLGTYIVGHSDRDTFAIFPSESITQEYKADGKNAVYSYPFDPGADSVKINFNSKRMLSYTLLDSTSRNPLLFENYTNTKISSSDGGVYECIFTIIEEDYNNAVPIEN